MVQLSTLLMHGVCFIGQIWLMWYMQWLLHYDIDVNRASLSMLAHLWRCHQCCIAWLLHLYMTNPLLPLPLLDTHRVLVCRGTAACHPGPIWRTIVA